MESNRLAKQIDFIVEIDKLKQVFRQTVLMDGSRKENDAEHSWHFALLAVLLSEYADPGIDSFRVVKMALIHDIVEIDAGDTFCYDQVGRKSQHQREVEAAHRIFNLLPADQAAELRALWEEFEAEQTPEAKFAAAIDRFQPLLHNLETAGHAWREHGVTREQVIARNRKIADAAPVLWQYMKQRLDAACDAGHLES
jgi:putative hydrolase of HD superfamily